MLTYYERAMTSLLHYHHAITKEYPGICYFEYDFSLSGGAIPSAFVGALTPIAKNRLFRQYVEGLRDTLNIFLNSYRRCKFSKIVKGYSWVFLNNVSGLPSVNIAFFVLPEDFNLANETKLGEYWQGLNVPDGFIEPYSVCLGYNQQNPLDRYERINKGTYCSLPRIRSFGMTQHRFKKTTLL